MREIWTIGHWTCPEAIFIGRLAEHGIGLLGDVRAHPGSRASPHFGRDTMRQWLDRAEIEYVHLEDLGGRRPKQDVDPDINGDGTPRASRTMRTTRCGRATRRGWTG
ncbi:MAG: DUF488 domain-containing protein [Ornithinibacter sp.]